MKIEDCTSIIELIFYLILFYSMIKSRVAKSLLSWRKKITVNYALLLLFAHVAMITSWSRDEKPRDENHVTKNHVTKITWSKTTWPLVYSTDSTFIYSIIYSNRFSNFFLNIAIAHMIIFMLFNFFPIFDYSWLISKLDITSCNMRIWKKKKRRKYSIETGVS